MKPLICLYIHLYSLKQNRHPTLQYHVLKQNTMDSYEPLPKLKQILLLTDKPYMLQIGFTHST